MALLRYSPAAPSFRNEVDDFLSNFFNPRYSGDSRQTGWKPPVEVKESDNAYDVLVETPGMERDDLKIEFNDGVLSVSGEKKHSEKNEKDSYFRTERCYGAFNRALHVPSDVKVDGIKASYKDGVLTVTLPKAEESKPKEITIG